MSPMLSVLTVLFTAQAALAANESCFEDVQLLQQRVSSSASSASSASSCSTNGGDKCHFPFEYNGKTYSECTTDGATSGRMWCAVKNSGWWGSTWDYCDDSCWTGACVTTETSATHHKALCSILEEDDCLSQGGFYYKDTHNCDVAFDSWQSSGMQESSYVACITVSYGAFMSQNPGATCKKVPESECKAGDDFIVGGEMDIYPGMECDEALKIHNEQIGTDVACVTDNGYQYRAQCSMVAGNCGGTSYPGYDCQEALVLHDAYRQQTACVNFEVENGDASGVSCQQVRDENQCHTALDLGLGSWRMAYHGWTCDNAMGNFHERVASGQLQLR